MTKKHVKNYLTTVCYLNGYSMANTILLTPKKTSSKYIKMRSYFKVLIEPDPTMKTDRQFD